MKRFPRQSMLAVLAFAAVAGWMVHDGFELRAQDAAKSSAAKQTGGGGKGGGKARAAVDTLGAGPWDLKTELSNVHVSVITKGVDHPWGLAILPNGDMLVTERPGRLRLVHNGVLDPTPLGPLPQIRAVSLGGLMDIACIRISRRITGFISPTLSRVRRRTRRTLPLPLAARVTTVEPRSTM